MAIFAPVVLIAAINFSEVSAQRYRTWESYAKLGRWARAELGRPPAIGGHGSVAQVSSYYSGGQSACCTLVRGPAAIAEIARFNKINFLLLSKREMRPFDTKGLFEELKRLGYEEVDPARLPEGTDGILVFEIKPAETKSADVEPSKQPNKAG